MTFTHSDAFLALSYTDEENAIVSMFAKTLETPKVVTMINKNNYIKLFQDAGLDGIVSAKSVTATSILQYIRSMSVVKGSEIESLHRLLDDTVEALEFNINEEIVGFTGIPLKSIKLQSGVLVAAIVHNDKVIIPCGDDIISNGDTVVVITTQGHIKGIKEIVIR